MTVSLIPKICPLDVPNKNKHIYSTEIVNQIIQDVNQNREGRLFGELGFPQREMGEPYAYFWERRVIINNANISHSIGDLRIQDGWLVGSMTTLSTPSGEILERMLGYLNIDFRFRGLGEFEEAGDGILRVKKFNLITIDAVKDGA